MARFEDLERPTHWNESFSKYPHGFTIYEALSKWLKRLDDLTDNINNWNDYLDDFVKSFDTELQDNIEKTLTEWQQDGTLDIVIDQALQTQIDTVESQLAENTSKVENIYSVLQFGAKGDGVTDDTNAIQQTVDNAIPHSTVLIPSTTNFYILSSITVDKPLYFRGGGVLKGTLNVISGLDIRNIGFINVDKAIVFTDGTEDLHVESCNFDNVDYPIYMYDETGTITNVENVSVKNNRFISPITGFTSRFKRIENLLIDGNKVKDINTAQRYAVAFRVGSNADGEVLVKNTLFTHNNIKNITNTGNTTDWECAGLLHFGENLIAEFNTIEGLQGNNDSEGIYSKGKNVNISNNILINSGGYEGAIVVKSDPLTSDGTIKIHDNQLLFDSQTMNGKNVVGILTNKKGVSVKKNQFINCYTGIETYTFGAEQLKAVSNEFDNCYQCFNFRGTDAGALNGDTLIKNNNSVYCSVFIVGNSLFITNGKFKIYDNDTFNLSIRFFVKRGQYKEIDVRNNDINMISGYSSHIMEFDDVHPDGETLKFNGNSFNETLGRVLVMLSDTTNYSPYVELNNNTVSGAERGFELVGTIDTMIMMNNNLLNVTSHQVVANPTTYYRLNNPGISDVTPT